MLPFLNSLSPTNAVPENLRAQGQITVDQITVAPLVLRHLQGDLKIGGRHVKLSAAKSQYYGGNLDGSLDAELTAIPSYHIHLDYSRVDLASLTAPFPTLDNAFDGDATGALTFDFHGADRADLISSMECRGNARVTDPQIKSLNLGESLRQGELAPGTSSFAGAATELPAATAKSRSRIGSRQSGRGDHRLRLRRTSPATSICACGASAGPANDAPLQITPLRGNGTYPLTGPLESPAIAPVRASPNRQ